MAQQLGQDGGASQADRLADLAVSALIAEAELTPKPGLVDARGAGAHVDVELHHFLASAEALRPTFAALARAAEGRRPSRSLREDLARIGRDGEAAMLAATGGANTHRGAIWALGLLVAAAALEGEGASPETICATAGAIARFPDACAPAQNLNGARACRAYGVSGARGEAADGFPHALLALEALRAARGRGVTEPHARTELSHMAQAAPSSPLPGGERACPGLDPGSRGEAEAGEGDQGFPERARPPHPPLRVDLSPPGRGEDPRFTSNPMAHHARIDALLTVMASLDDTCLLHRGGRRALRVARLGARAALRAGGAGTPAGMRALMALDRRLLALNASPGGAADMLAAALLLDALGASRHPGGRETSSRDRLQDRTRHGPARPDHPRSASSSTSEVGPPVKPEDDGALRSETENPLTRSLTLATPDQVRGRLSPRRGEVKSGAASSPLPGGERADDASHPGEGASRLQGSATAGAVRYDAVFGEA
ncbi:triphosphoribosyl-dephospho-CoA synthase [Methylopila sp. M107]|uniref:triphosphoribosyl-dephospho-CoA synthase n=1 Tax=Methylopila sp. M107 TaxID=1101190 RepID=UPI0018C91296|nr:triphosphoribosyl-dephospho-CoA synthase [Methylopila sp. M107]